MTNPQMLRSQAASHFRRQCCRPPAPAPARTARRGAFTLLAGAIVLLAAACTYRGDIDDPFVRRAQWFSYVKGDDIAAACTEGTSDNYRLVYNADFLEQVRAYEVSADGSGGASMIARASPGGASLADINPADPHGWWQWYRSDAHLDPAQFEDLRARLAADGYFAHRDGLIRLNSRDYYWLVSGCVDGRFEHGAWLNGPQNLAALTFPALLFAHDETGLPVAPPRWVAAGDRYGRSGHAGEDETIRPFWITIDDRAAPGS